MQKGNVKDGLYCRQSSGIPHGPYAAFHANGVKATDGQYANGVRVGLWTYFNEKGEKVGETQFSGDNYHGKRVEYFANGKPRLVEEYVNGRHEGSVQEYSQDGKLVRQAMYHDDRVVDAK